MARIGICLLLVLGLFQHLVAAENIEPLLKDGEVWISTSSSKLIQITNTDGKIDKVEISSSTRYVAANKIIDFYEQENDIENPTSYTQEPIYSVLIIDLNSKKVIADLKIPREITHPLGWQPDGTYQFGEGSPLDIHTIYQYNPATGEVKKLDE